MSKICIVVFKRNISYIPSQLKHWGIYVEYEEKINTEYLYHADKVSILNIQTEYEGKHWSPSNNKKVDKVITIGYASKLTHTQMIEYCDEITRNRIFNTIGNNCQRWVISLLIKLIEKDHLYCKCYDILKQDNEITPLLGWF